MVMIKTSKVAPKQDNKTWKTNKRTMERSFSSSHWTSVVLKIHTMQVFALH